MIGDLVVTFERKFMIDSKHNIIVILYVRFSVGKYPQRRMKIGSDELFTK